MAGREELIERMMLVLGRKTKRNPLLLGPPGVGKSALVEALSQRIVAGSVPSSLREYSILSLNLGSLLAGTAYRGDFEQRLRSLVDQLRLPGARRILFVDEIHLLDRAGRSEGGLDAASLLKPLLARGELPCIGASTPPEWQSLVERDPAMERRFLPVPVPEPGTEECFRILCALRPRLEAHHRVEISDEALRLALQPSTEPHSSRYLPDRAIDRLDEACVRLSLQLQEHSVSGEGRALQIALSKAEACFDLDAVVCLRNRVRTLLRTALPPPRLVAQNFGA
jgi:ATP-dependent Clp protease ATP-binding subunit ClpA